MTNILNIVIGGAAGQGLATIGRLLANTLVECGYYIVVSQSYESRVRGGHNTFTIRTSNEPLHAPQESIDLLIALNAETVQLHRGELSEHGFIVTDAEVGVEDIPYLSVPYGELTSARYENVAALGIAAYLLGLDQSVAAEVLEHKFGRKGATVIEANEQALSASYQWAAEQLSAKQADLRFPKLPPTKRQSQRLILNGNEALALGALSAGVKFCSFYPMTPATSIAITLNEHASRMGIIVEQAEDEIAAINMALGASFVGAPSIVTTSGGGFALMTEGVSLSAMTETPVVIVVGQRPGPATGLPTRTEQADLEMVLYAGHGEFPRAILAPGSVEGCFHAARKAFELAEKYQGPVFILTDQFIADSHRAVVPFNVEDLSSLKVGADSSRVALPYRRYALTENGISPRLLPGAGKHLVVADSDEHGEDGHLTEDLSVRARMVRKRLNKLAGLKSEVLAPGYDGDREPDLLLVSWGTTLGSMLEAAARLRSTGIKAATLHFAQVWPLVSEQFIQYLQRAKQVVCIESNATGQFAGLIGRETGFGIQRRILRYDGLPITPEFILRGLGS